MIVYTLLGMFILWPTQKALIKEGRDIRQDYIGGQRLFRRIDLYSRFSQDELANIDVDPELGMPLNFHPPTTLIFFAPLALLNFQYAVILWGIISLLAFFASIYLIMNELGYLKWFFLSLGLVFWFPLWLHMRFGQFSILIFLFLTLFWLNVRKNKEFKASLFLALACLVKIFPLFMLLLMLLKKQWRILIYSLFIIGIVVVALYLYYPDSIISYLTKVATENDEIFRTYFGNFSFNGFVGRLFNGTSGIAPLFSNGSSETLIRYSGIILIILLSIVFALRVNNFDLCFSIYIIAMLIVSPTTWAHSFILLLLPGFFIVYYLFSRSGDWLRKSLFVLVIILSCIPHWQYYEWLRTISPMQLLPSWLLFTSPGFYVLASMFVLMFLEGDHFIRSTTQVDKIKS
ncbi:MAG: DUF2029 domain-containing protein [Ardenticatenaceae bacterium]|nr:DUF2029 domain-containing protein [Ardenticatenaceae bacterium]